MRMNVRYHLSSSKPNSSSEYFELKNLRRLHTIEGYTYQILVKPQIAYGFWRTSIHHPQYRYGKRMSVWKESYIGHCHLLLTI